MRFGPLQRRPEALKRGAPVENRHPSHKGPVGGLVLPDVFDSDWLRWLIATAAMGELGPIDAVCEKHAERLLERRLRRLVDAQACARKC